MNHPKIRHLYDVGPNFLELGWVEGEALADRMKHGAIPLDEVLAIAQQTAGQRSTEYLRTVIAMFP